MAGSVDTGEVELALVARPHGLMMLIGSVPNLEPFKSVRPKTDLWIGWKAPSHENRTCTQLNFTVRPRSCTTDAAIEEIARSAPIGHAQVHVLELLARQVIVDFFAVDQRALNGNQSENFAHLLAYVEPSWYDWRRNQQLRCQFEAERRGKSPKRNSDRRP